MYNITISKDGDDYLAEVEGMDNLFAYGDTKKETKDELLGVVEMYMDYQLEQVEKSKIIKDNLQDYAI